MKRFQVEWMQYVTAGSHCFAQDDKTQVMCFFETPVYTDCASNARKHLERLFGRIRIISVAEYGVPVADKA